MLRVFPSSANSTKRWSAFPSAAWNRRARPTTSPCPNMRPASATSLGDSGDRFPGDALVELEIAAGNADPADAFAARHDRAAAFHRGPALGSGGEREAERVQHIERLAHRTGGAGRTLVRSRAYRLGGGGVHRM